MDDWSLTEDEKAVPLKGEVFEWYADLTDHPEAYVDSVSGSSAFWIAVSRYIEHPSNPQRFGITLFNDDWTILDCFADRTLQGALGFANELIGWTQVKWVRCNVPVIGNLPDPLSLNLFQDPKEAFKHVRWRIPPEAVRESERERILDPLRDASVRHPRDYPVGVLVYVPSTGAYNRFHWFESRQQMLDVLLLAVPAVQRWLDDDYDSIVTTLGKVRGARPDPDELTDALFLALDQTRNSDHIQLRWWGSVDDLAHRDSEFCRELRWAHRESSLYYAGDRETIPEDTPITPDEFDAFLDALNEWGEGDVDRVYW